MKQILALTLFLAPVLFGQTNRGGISGSVTDPSGGVVPAANVVVIDLGTNEKHAVTTSSSGTYSVPNLEPVTYRVEVDATGFKKAVTNGVKVDTASVAT